MTDIICVSIICGSCLFLAVLYLADRWVMRWRSELAQAVKIADMIASLPAAGTIQDLKSRIEALELRHTLGGGDR